MADITRTRLTLDEFRALPESMDHIELIDGELIMSPAPKNKHQNAVGNAFVQLKQLPQGTTVVSPMDVYLDDEQRPAAGRVLGERCGQPVQDWRG